MQQQSFPLIFKGEEYRGHYCKEISSAENFLSHLMKQDCTFGIDTETMALPKFKYIPTAALSPHLSRIRLLQIFDGQHSFVFDMLHLPLAMFKEFLTTKHFIAHNGVFELSFLINQHIGPINVGCTFLLAKTLFHATYPTDEGLSASLQALVNEVFGEVILKKNQLSDWSIPDLTFEQIEYAALDALCTLKLAEKLGPGLEQLGLTRAYRLVRDAQVAIARMQLKGFKLDVEKHRAMIPKWKDEVYSAQKEILKITGLSSVTGPAIAKWLEKNLPKEVSSIWPRTEKSERLATDKSTLIEFGWVPVIKPFADYQKKKTLLSTFGNSLIQKVNPVTGRLHASFKMLGARTGRLSASAPNLHNIVRSPSKEEKEQGIADIRDNFIVHPGFKFLDADYSQIELRVAAEVSRDERMLNIYATGSDMYKTMASALTGKAINDITKQERQFSKALVLGLIYGLGANSFSKYAKNGYGIDVDKDKAADSIDVFRNTFPQYYSWQMEQARQGRHTLYSRTPLGKLRRLEEGNTFGAAMNTPIQGGAGEIITSSITRIDRELYSNFKDSYLINCVHDENAVESCDEEADRASEAMKECMIDAFKDVFPNGITNGLVEVGRGMTWAQAKE